MMERNYKYYLVLRQCANDWPLIAIYHIKIENLRKNDGRKSKAKEPRYRLLPATPSALSSVTSHSQITTDDTGISSGVESRPRSPRSVFRENLAKTLILKTPKTSTTPSTVQTPSTQSKTAVTMNTLSRTIPKSHYSAVGHLALQTTPVNIELQKFSKTLPPHAFSPTLSDTAAEVYLDTHRSTTEDDDSSEPIQQPKRRTSGRPLKKIEKAK